MTSPKLQAIIDARIGMAGSVVYEWALQIDGPSRFEPVTIAPLQWVIAIPAWCVVGAEVRSRGSSTPDPAYVLTILEVDHRMCLVRGKDGREWPLETAKLAAYWEAVGAMLSIPGPGERSRG